MIEPRLRAGLFQLRPEAGFQAGAVELDQFVKLLRLLLAPGAGQAGVGEGGGIDLIRLKRLEQRGAGRLPGRRIGVVAVGRDDTEVGYGRHRAEHLAHLDHRGDCRLIVGLAGLLGFHCGHARRDLLLERQELIQEIFAAGHDERVLQPLVMDEIQVELHDRPLERRADRILHGLGQPGLLLDRGPVRPDLGQGETAVARGDETHQREHLLGGAGVVDLQVLVLLAHEREEVGIIDRERRIRVRLLRAENDVEHPLRRAADEIAAEERRTDALAALEAEEGTAGLRVDGLDPTVGEERELAKANQVERAGVLRGEQRFADVEDGDR